MKKLLPDNRNRIIVFLFAVAVTFASCRTSREISTDRIRPISTEKLLEEVEQSAFDYSNLTIRRINVQFSDNNTRTSFRANLKAKKDEKILASVSKLNIPVGRVLLTPQNLTYVNYIDKNYFEGDYSFLSRLLNFSLSFETIQAIISNNAISYRHPQYNRNFESFVENGKYVLQSANNRQNVKSGRLKNLFAGGALPSPDGETFEENDIVQTMYFNPRNFSLERLIYNDTQNAWNLEVNFSDFERVEKKDYPGAIDMKMTSPGETIQLKIKLNGFSTEKIDSIELNIPGSYDRIRAH